ncbi:MAG: DUF5706 domain-containing protein [Flavobacteriaceae bacterium]|nr:DUF5706 domain-containing protein [Flavobacteriaceae bacterium]MCY4217050.1 DUF5706 domain-containing protein [Flavobacteriaceae bacterium]MCY4253651.1 DUF5706 domain-containing protein [Flavobacteriaceae bacterium]
MKSIDVKEAEEARTDNFETRKEPRKSFQTFLRNQNRLYINSFNIIDRKASIMIRMNSIIISGVFLFYNNVKDVELGSLIGLILIICCFLSLLFALNASRPNSFGALFFIKQNTKKRQLKTEETLFVSGINTHLTEEDFEKAFDKVVKDQKLQIGNQARAIYMFEKRIRQSFFHIEVSYLTFMFGFVSVVILFVIGNL